MSRFISNALCCLALAALSITSTTAIAQSACTAKLLVSGYFSTVHIYDACSGQYLRDLDTNTRIRGPQAIRLGPDGAIHVVSEESSQILRYRADTFEFLGEFIAVPLGMKPTGLTFGPDGAAYVSGYGTDDVRRFNADGKSPTRLILPNASGLNGADNGLTFGPDGKIYVPGYDSNNVVRIDPATGVSNVAITASSNGLRGTRAILADRNGQQLWITGETSGQLLKYTIATGAVQVVATGFNRPTGLDYAPNGDLLIVTSNSVEKLDPATGANKGTLVASGSGGLNGGTFVLVLNNAQAKPPVDTAQVGSQYWVAGLTTMAGNVLDFASMESANGALFGAGFRATDVARKRWGKIRIEFTSCTTANFTWQSDETNSAGFGSGGYPLSRLVSNEATQKCETQGFAAADKSWIVGTWSGGDTRSGEGILLDHRASDRITFAAWFTFRPTR